MIEVVLNKVIIDENREDQVIVLKEKDGQRILPIVIGRLEANAIKIKLSGIDHPRPLTHDLFKNMLEGLEANLEKIYIDKLEEDTFHAKLFIKTKNDGIKVVDARPSDSIALAVRTSSPIFAEDEILKNIESLV